MFSNSVFNLYKAKLSALPPLAAAPPPQIGKDGKPVKVSAKLSILSGGLAVGVEIMMTYPTELVCII